MAEVLASFANPVSDDIGDYYARAIGRQAADKMWEGWIEFVPIQAGGEVLVSRIESRQPERQHLEYWATGLTPVYLEGALHRARNPLTVRVPVVEEPFSERPAATRVFHTSVPPVQTILDPFEIGARNLDILRQELTALNRPRLLNIITAYDLDSDADVSAMSDSQLVGFIVSAVANVLSTRSR